MEKSAFMADGNFTDKYDFLSNSARKRRLPDLAATKLGVDILRGVYKPGSRLPEENEGGSLSAMSRMAYCQAVCVLISKGLVEDGGKRGIRVRAIEHWDLLDAEALRWSFMAGPRADFRQSLFDQRMATEPAVAKLAASRRSDDELMQLRLTLDVMASEAPASDDGRQAEITFHSLLVKAARNEAFTAMGRTIETFVAWPALFKSQNARPNRDALPEHERVYEAVARQDGEGARTAMKNLIRLAEADFQYA